MIISITGTPGSGKTTVAEIVAEKLRLKSYYMGSIRRETAKERGMTIEEFNELGKTDPSTDKVVDDYLVKLGKEEDDFIVQSRTAFHFIPNSIKIYLKVDLDEGARRIFYHLQTEEGNKMRNEKKVQNIEEAKRKLIEREECDRERYQKYYDIDVTDMSNYDLVVDTTNISAEEAAEKVLEYVANI